jgi:hypothetical protein
MYRASHHQSSRRIKLDIGACIRLRNSAKEALASLPEDQGSAWRGLTSIYVQLRAQVASVVSEPQSAEFNALFPNEISVGAADNSIIHDPGAMFAQQDVASQARSLIGALAGWLDGFIEEAQFAAKLHAEAEAYARERVKSEREFGFSGH